MTKTSSDSIIRTLRYSDGLTSEEVAQRLGVPKSRVGAQLSKLSLHGHIERERLPGHGYGGSRKIYRYYAKPRQTVGNHSHRNPQQ